MSRATYLPRPPQPMRPTTTRSLAPRIRCADSAVTRKSRRSIAPPVAKVIMVDAMNRRGFLTTGYSLMFSAGPLLAQDRPAPDFVRIVPPSGKRRPAPGEPNMTLVELNTDVLVAGGGMAGVCAAVAAARNGAKVVLVQDRSRLGGNASSEVKMHIVGANCHRGRPGWRDSGLIEEFRLDDAVNNPQRCFELFDLLLYDKVVSEPNITLLLESVLYSAKKTGDRIDEVMVRCDKSEHLYRIRAKIFCDCTGDSRLGLEAGAEMRFGREARSEFNETLAPEKPDSETLGSSILFTARHHDRPMPFTPPKWARKVTREQLRMRKITSWEYGYWWIEWGGNLNTIWDNERIRFELLSIVMGIWDYIKNSGDHPSSAAWALDWVGMMPGKRGSRRIVGDHILTQHDVMRGSCLEFAHNGLAGRGQVLGLPLSSDAAAGGLCALDDAVAIGGWPMDDHPPGGFDRPDLAPNTSIQPPQVYNIPLRSLYSRNVRNLIMAGRNISASHLAFTSARVMATCAVIGQAAGTAAAQCAREGVTPRELAGDRKQVFALQQRLLRDDQTIRDAVNQDPADLARTAKVTASAERDDAKAAYLINGRTRDIPGKEINHWAARMGAEGAWIELAWDRPHRINEIQITFDTGFQRELTLSAQNSVNQGVIRAPQPETVRDYELLYRKPGGGDLISIVSVKDNHQRLRRHRIDAIETQAVRLHVGATNGDPYARVFEIRCYA